MTIIIEHEIRTLDQLRPILRGLRKSAGLTQAMLARRLGVTQQTYAQFEGNPASASVERLFNVALRDARADQCAHRRRERARGARRELQQHRERERAAMPEAVGGGAPDELRHGERGRERGERCLRAFDRAAELLRQRRHGGEIKVGGEEPDGRQQGQREDRSERMHA